MASRRRPFAAPRARGEPRLRKMRAARADRLAHVACARHIPLERGGNFMTGAAKFEQAELRLQAMDAEDLVALSVHLQDALARVGDMGYAANKRRFALIVSRFDWAADTDGRLERCRAGVHFEGVANVRCRGVPRDDPHAVLNLLAVTFQPGAEPPGGILRLVFAGGAEIALDVECVEAGLADLGPRWPAGHRPSHPLDEGANRGS
jgi:hypothetical protein